ncbi:hypothetical protein [Flavivirga jejuensis]
MEGTLAYVLIGLAIVLLLIALLIFCPLYKASRISTKK